MIKRTVTFLLTMCLIISMIPGPVFAVSGDEQIGSVIAGSGEGDVELIEDTTEDETVAEETEEEVTEVVITEDEATEEAVTVKTISEEESTEEETTIPGEGCTAHEDGMHIHEAVVTEPSCDAAGYTTYTCLCGDSYAADHEDATGHNVRNGACTACGKIAPVVTVSNIEKTGKVKVTWEPVEGAAKYKVYRATEKNGEYTRILTTSGTVCNHVSAVAGTTYYYKIVAVDASGKAVSLESKAVGRTCDLPQPVVTASNTAKNRKPRLTWNSVEGAVKYQVYRATSIDGTYTRILTTTGTVCNNTSAETGKVYFYKVRAIAQNSNANSAYSTISTNGAALKQTVVTAVNMEKTGKIKVTWESVEAARKYEVYRATELNGEYTKIMTTTGTTCNNVSVVAGTTYYYKVKAIAQNSLCDSEFSKVVSCRAALAQPVLTASNVAETGKIQLTWNQVAGAQKYKVYRATERNGKYTRILTTTTTSCIDSNTVAGTSYYYYVVAITENAAASSAPSVIQKRTADCAKPTVTGMPDINTGKPRLNWEAVEGAVTYKIYRATTPDGEYELMHSTKGNTYQNVTAEVGNTYYYKITAQGKSSASVSVLSDVVEVQAVSSEFKYVYSSYTTTKAGSAERNTNLYLSCKAINGTILAPGDTFSFNEIVGPRTAEKGYQSAPIVGGMGRGGGICQVSTTLFNVALYANMDITQRKQHSVAVTYVPMGRDAMIYKTASDLKFVNNSEYYVKVLASANGGTVSISLMTREENVSPKEDVDLQVTYANGTYTLKRYYQGEVNYSCKSKY